MQFQEKEVFATLEEIMTDQNRQNGLLSFWGCAM
jgi:hypothetical protein